MLKTYIERPEYISKITPYINKDLIKILVGQRRVGKSYILLQIIAAIKKKKVPNKRILYIDKELYEFENIKDDKDLINHVKTYFKNIKSKKYLFIDEVQEIKDFHKTIRALNAQGDYDIYITGSNAEMLSGDIANSLGGRSISFEVFGLSLQEYLNFHKLKYNKQVLLDYIKYGSLPYLISLDKDEEMISTYLRNIYNTILLRDVVERYKVRNPAFLDRLILFLAANTGTIVSAKSISDYLKSQKTSISSSVILNYLKYFHNAYFIHQVPRSEIAGKKVFQINQKHYFNDLGIRHALIGYKANDINQVIENLVYIHLRRLGYSVSVGQLGAYEIDFVAEKAGIKKYYQVAYQISDDKTFAREFGNLLKIKDNHPKYVISMDEMIRGDYQGIKHLELSEFLLSGNHDA